MQRINFEKFEVNEELREIVFSCASDLPYERYDAANDLYYNQILVIDQTAANLSRLNNSAPVLFNHNTDLLLGAVQQAWIVENKIYVKVRFSKNDIFADRIYKDIIDGVIKNVSIGYQVEDYEDRKENGVYNRYVTKWMLFEVSIVSIPADDSVGFRNLNIIKEMPPMEDENKIEAAPEEVATEVKEAAPELEALQQENEALKAEVAKLERLLEEAPEEEAAPAEEEAPAPAEEEAPAELDDEEKEEIKQIGADFEVPEEEVRKALAEKMTVREFKKKIKSFNITKKENYNMNRQSFRDYLAARNFDTPFALRDFAGFADPALVSSEGLSLEAMLAKRMGLKNFRTIAGLTSQIEIPVQKGRVTVGQIGINEASTDSKPTFEKITLAPKKFVASTVIGKEMLTASNSDVEAFIIDTITRELAYEVENYMLGKVAEGAATELNISALNAFTWQDALSFQAAIGNYQMGEASFIMSAPARAALKGIEKAQGTAQFICQNNEINGYRVDVSGCVKNDNIYMGAWENLVLASFAEGLTITVDPYTEARSGAVVIVGSLCADAGVLAPEAFAVGKVQA